MNKQKCALGALAVLSLSGIAQVITSRAVSDDWTLAGHDRPRPLLEVGTDSGCASSMPARRAAPRENMAADQQHVGDFYRMVLTYGGLAPAMAALDQICAMQAPGLILTVYRPGDGYRDGWCVARYGEAARIQQVEARSSAACR